MEQPKKISHDKITELLSHPPKAPAVTIYLPTHRSASPQNMSGDEIRLKNVKSKALEIMHSRDDARKFAPWFEQRMDELLNSQTFIEQLQDGLLICARPEQFEIFFLPYDTSEYVAVADQYHLAPIFGLISELSEYYLLSVSQHQPMLYKGDLYGLSPTDLVLPATLEEGLRIDEMGQENEQQRSSSGRNTFNGRGGDKNPAEEERQRFWRLIDKLVVDHTDHKIELILAGTDSEISEYRSHSSYPKLSEKHIEGSFTNVKAHEIFPLARKQLLDLLDRERIAAKDSYLRAKGQNSNITADQFASIDKAASEGRIETLLIATLRQTTDTVRDDMATETVIEMPEQANAQPLNEIARTVWNAGGRIVNLKVDQMPEPAAALAIMRF